MNFYWLETAGMDVADIIDQSGYRGICKIKLLIRSKRPDHCFDEFPGCDNCEHAEADHQKIRDYLLGLSKAGSTTRDHGNRIIRTKGNKVFFENSGYHNGLVTARISR